MAVACADEQLKKIGDFHPVKDTQNSRPYILVIASKANVKIKVQGKENFALSSTPELWYLKDSRLFRNYTFEETHGLKIKYGGYDIKPDDVFIYRDGRFYQVSRFSLRSVFQCTDKNKKVELRDKEIWFDGQNIGELPETGVEGKWYTDLQDLEIVLASDFQDDLILDLNEDSHGTLSGFKGNELELRLNGNTSLTSGAIATKYCYMHSGAASRLNVESLTCDKLDASAEKESTIVIKSGHVTKASTGELFGGKVSVLAKVDKVDDKTIGLNNTQKIIRNQTTEGTTINFPKGNFELK